MIKNSAEWFLSIHISFIVGILERIASKNALKKHQLFIRNLKMQEIKLRTVIIVETHNKNINVLMELHRASNDLCKEEYIQ